MKQHLFRDNVCALAQTHSEPLFRAPQVVQTYHNIRHHLPPPQCVLRKQFPTPNILETFQTPRIMLLCYYPWYLDCQPIALYP